MEAAGTTENARLAFASQQKPKPCPITAMATGLDSDRRQAEGKRNRDTSEQRRRRKLGKCRESRVLPPGTFSPIPSSKLK